MSEAAALRDQRVDPVMFVKLDLADGPIRLWSGVNNRKGGPWSGESAAVYRGRVLRNLPRLKQLVDARADRIDLALSARHPSIKALLSDRADEIPYAPVDIAIAAFANMAPHPDVGFPLFSAPYTAETVGFRFEGETPVVVIGCGNAMVIRKRTASAYWTDAAQQAAFAGDLGLDRLVLYDEGVTLQFKPGPD